MISSVARSPNQQKNISKSVIPTQTFRSQSNEPPILGIETLNASEIKEELPNQKIAIKINYIF